MKTKESILINWIRDVFTPRMKLIVLLQDDSFYESEIDELLLEYAMLMIEQQPNEEEHKKVIAYVDSLLLELDWEERMPNEFKPKTLLN